MGVGRFDRGLAAAESALDRVDDTADVAVSGGAVDVTEEGLHIEDSVVESDEVDEDGGDEHNGDEAVAMIDAFAEAFNARDLDMLLELVAPDVETPGLGNDIDNFPDAIEDLWERRPSCLLTRGIFDGQALGVLWELSSGSEWWRLGTLHVDDCRDGRIGVAEFSDDPTLLEQVETDGPDGDVDQGMQWEEWEDGAVG